MVAESQASTVSSKMINGGENGHKGNRSCKIVLLDGSECEINLKRNAKGSELFDKITQRLNLWEKDYFGLSYRDLDGLRMWLNYEKSIAKQLRGNAWVLWFEVKFYPPEPSQLQENVTKYYLYLQIQRDIVSGKLPCSFFTYALLGSYLVQAQLGDYDRLDLNHATAAKEDYLKDFKLAPYISTELLHKVAELHKAHRGISSETAESKYLEISKTLAMYGVDLHSARDMENAELALGVCSSGLLVYKDRLRVNRFAWPKILKISFRRTHFYIKIRPGEFEQRDTTVGFRLMNYKAAERLWKSCVEQHTFFRLMSPEPPPKKSILRFGSSRFRFSGRTFYQTRLASALIERQPPNFQRSQSARFHHAKPETGSVNVTDQLAVSPSSGNTSPKHYYVSQATRPHSVGDQLPMPVYSLQRDNDLVEYALPANLLTPPHKEYYIIAPQKSPSVDVDKNGLSPAISPTGATVKTVSYENGGPVRSNAKVLIPIFEQVHPSKAGLLEKQASVEDQTGYPETDKRLSGPNDRLVMEQVENVTEQGPTNVERIIEADGSIRTTTSSSQTKTVKRIIQRQTVQTFLPSAAESDIDNEFQDHVEKTIDVYSDGDIDHDAELTAAILEATKMDPCYQVEKIEVKRCDH